ncbi:hypothetical protein MJO29_015697, partial [Puccinia striiformis f. sp. tritici]
KSQIPMDPEAIAIVEQTSKLAYKHFISGDYETLINLYKKFLDGHSSWCDTLKECSQLLIIQANLNLPGLGVQHRCQADPSDGNHEQVVQLIQQHLSFCDVESHQLGKSIMELLIELYWSLAETLFILRNYSNAREALEQICDPEKILCLTASHKLFKRLLRLHWELKNIGANGILEDSEKIGRGGFSV